MQNMREGDSSSRYRRLLAGIVFWIVDNKQCDDVFLCAYGKMEIMPS